MITFNKVPETLNVPLRQRADMLREWLRNDTFEQDGAIYWQTSGNVVPLDTFRDAYAVAPEGQEAARRAQVDVHLAQYREARRNYVPSAEEMFEMRAAFGPGETVVDVITGQRFTT